MPEPVGEFGWDDVVPYLGKGVNLITPRVRRLALAVLAGVFFGLTGAAVASASADTPTPAQSSTAQVNFDWW
jgi:hypothetical protein